MEEITESYPNAATALKKGAKKGKGREIEAEIGRVSMGRLNCAGQAGAGTALFALSFGVGVIGGRIFK